MNRPEPFGARQNWLYLGDDVGGTNVIYYDRVVGDPQNYVTLCTERCLHAFRGTHDLRHDLRRR